MIPKRIFGFIVTMLGARILSARSAGNDFTPGLAAKKLALFQCDVMLFL
jgi:hypothetical protein